jgi:hypothetical protein
MISFFASSSLNRRINDKIAWSVLKQIIKYSSPVAPSLFGFPQCPERSLSPSMQLCQGSWKERNEVSYRHVVHERTD